MAPTEIDDGLGVIDPASDLAIGDSVQGREGQAGSIGHDLHSADGVRIFGESHDAELSRFRESCQQFSGRSNVIPFMGYSPRRGNPVHKSVSEAIFAALFALVQRDGWPAVKRRTGLGKSKTSRWEQAFTAGARPGFNQDSFDALMQLDEVRSAAAAAASTEPDSNGVVWRQIAGALSELMDPNAGWVLVQRLRRMKELGLLDPNFNLLRGAIEQRENAVAPDSPVRKLARHKGIRET